MGGEKRCLLAVKMSDHSACSTGRLGSYTAARRKVELNSVRYVNSGFQTHSERIRSEGKTRDDEPFFLLYVSSYEG
jgi:hypothetical protein